MLRALALLLVAAMAAPARSEPAPRQEPGFVEVELRITAQRPRGVVVDRGRNDGLLEGDRVVFHPREGGIREGTVIELADRGALVELVGPAVVLVPGTRGVVRIPRSRFEVPESTETAEEEVAPAEAPEHPPWAQQDEAWKPGMPLLADVRPIRPEDREPVVTGRIYAIADQSWATEGERTNGFYRAGGSVQYENPFGDGGRLQIDGEVNYREVDVDDDEDEKFSRLRLDRLSYALGGTRFADQRFEFGRFLQQGLPEFGVVDGFEWGQRLSNGNRVGASLGFMPEPDEDYHTGDDLQIGAYYEWVSEETEELTATAGYQKSFHDLDADRDLVVAKVAYLPRDTWTYDATAWLDIYTSGDEAKGAGVELTQAYASARRTWDTGSRLNVTYSHLAFPEMDREEFTPVTADQLADDHNDRLAIYGARAMGDDAELYAEVGGWIDEDESGGDGELGLGLEEVLLREGLFDVAVFGVNGRFSSVLGGRVGIGLDFGAARWLLGYEFSNQDQLGFTDGNDDIPQHRVHTSWDVNTASGWSFNVHADALRYDDEGAVSVGFYLQKSF